MLSQIAHHGQQNLKIQIVMEFQIFTLEMEVDILYTLMDTLLVNLTGQQGLISTPIMMLTLDVNIEKNMVENH